MKKAILREEFLKEFAKALIQEKIRQQRKKAQLEMVRVPSLVILEKPVVPSMITPTIVRKRTIIRHPLITKPAKIEAPEKPAFAAPPAVVAAPPPARLKEAITLARIEQLLADPAVLSVECTSPGRPLLINRGGAIQTTALTLSPEEVSNIMQEISDRTRIPLTSGLFKAFFGNYIITAVMSELVGTRFIIQKRYYLAPI